MLTVNLINRTILIVAGMTLVASCGASSSRYAIRPSVNPASMVQINQRLEIPNLRARVFIQYGAEITKRNIDKLNTYCSVQMQHLHTAGEPKLTVSPGQFDIIKVRQYNDHLYFPRTFVASRDWMADRPSNVIFEVEMRLKSAEQPGVRALICAKHVDYIRRQNYPTLAEIRIALGDAITIRTP